MLSENIQKEELSFSYLQAVCAHVGIALERHHHDEDGIDGQIKYVFKRKNGDEFESIISYQLKSTADPLTENNGFIHYPLKSKNYNDLVRPASCPQFLFLLLLPEEREKRIIHSVEQLVIKKCMYWYNLAGKKTTNESSVTIKINIQNVVSPENIVMLLKDQDPSALQGENDAND